MRRFVARPQKGGYFVRGLHHNVFSSHRKSRLKGGALFHTSNVGKLTDVGNVPRAFEERKSFPPPNRQIVKQPRQRQSPVYPVTRPSGQYNLDHSVTETLKNLRVDAPIQQSIPSFSDYSAFEKKTLHAHTRKLEQEGYGKKDEQGEDDSEADEEDSGPSLKKLKLLALDTLRKETKQSKAWNKQSSKQKLSTILRMVAIVSKKKGISGKNFIQGFHQAVKSHK